MFEHHFAPVTYAVGRSRHSADPHLKPFLWGCVANLSAVVVGLWIAGLLWRGRGSGLKATSIDPRALRYIAALLFGPPLITLALAAVTGSGLRTSWSNSMFNLAGLFAVGWLSPRVNAHTLKRLWGFVLVLLVILPFGYAAVFTPFIYRPSRLARVQWPQAEIANRFQNIWATVTSDLPLRIVTGRNWVAGLVGLTARDRPSILNNGRLDFSPWISQERIERQGMLILWDGAADMLPAPLEPYRGHHPSGTELFKASGLASDIVINWIVVPPKSSP
jgi:hypothetical protein